jgi:cytochrome d ubiquinol oxidase subunit II
MINYEILRLIWWAIMGIVLAGFAVMDGFDLGVAMLIPLAGHKDVERRVIINTVGPVWEGNQVWIILGGGVLFAAWPFLYATSFSGFYLAILLLLATFIFRPVGFKYRSKLTSKTWRSFWDYMLAICGFLSAIVFGVAIGNVIQGVPFYFDSTLRMFYTGGFWALFNGFSILCGLTSAAMLLMHGGYYLSAKTDGVIRERAIYVSRLAMVFMVFLFAGGGIWVAYGINGYVLTHIASLTGPSNPLYKTVATQPGAWIANYVNYPYFMIAPIFGFAGAILAAFVPRKLNGKLSFFLSSLSVIGVVLTVGVSMFPFIMPSSSNPGSSLTVWDSSASQLSLEIMLVVAIIFLPIILCYTAWVYHVLKGKVNEQTVSDNDQSY